MNTVQQAWAEQAYSLIRSEFQELNTAPEKAVVSFSFPSRGGLAAKKRRVGECWNLVGEGAAILLHPELWTSAPAVLATLAHEMVHAVLPKETGHKAPFQRIAKAIGFEPPWAGTRPSEALAARLNALAARLPRFPEVNLQPGTKKRQTTRLRLWECPCKVKVRVARDDFAAHCDLCGGSFELVQRG